jgi:hypothetical protein
MQRVREIVAEQQALPDALRRMPAAPAQSLARLRRSRIVCSDETTVRIGGQTDLDWVFQND